MSKLSAKEIIEKLTAYRKYGVVILGPTGTDENRLRVYLNGGDIGRISVKDENSHEILADSEYMKYLFSKEDKSKLEGFIREAKGEGENPRDKGEILCDKEYIACMAKATNYRFHNCNEKNNYQLVKGERIVETSMIAQQGKIKNEDGNLLIYDMEYAIVLPTRPNKKNPKNPKISEPDFIVFDGTNIGIVELKYNSENMTDDANSLGEHFEDFMDFIWKGENEGKWKIVEKSINRLKCLKEYGLIDKSWYKKIEDLGKWYEKYSVGDFVTDRIWIGFYFVEGPRKRQNSQEEYVQKEVYKQLAKPMKKAKKEKHNTKVLYGYCKDDRNMKLAFDKEIVLDEADNISFIELQK